MKTTIYYKIRCLAIAFLAVFLLAPFGWAATYYVDATNGNDGYKGLSETFPWKTIAKVNSSRFQPGDQILFKRGELWREQLNVPTSGIPSNPVVYEAYGTGDKPIISAAEPISSWIRDSMQQPIYKANKPIIVPNVVLFDTDVGVKKQYLSDLSHDKEWCLANGMLYVFSEVSPDNRTIEVGRRDYGILIWKKDNVVFQDLEIRYSNHEWAGGICLYNANHIRVSGCTIRATAGTGIYGGNIQGAYSDYATIFKNTIRDTGSHGIRFEFGENATIDSNVISNSGRIDIYASGILLDRGAENSGNVVTGNSISESADEGIELSDFSNYNLVSGNTVNNNGGNGISVKGNYNVIEHNEVYSNVISLVLGYSGSGISVYDHSGHGGPLSGQFNTIRYNRVYNNETKRNADPMADGNGIILDFADYNQVYYNIVYGNDGRGILIFEGSNNSVLNNVVYGNGRNRSNNHTNRERAELSIWGSSHNNRMKNNIAYGTESYVFVAAIPPGTYFDIDYNCYYKANSRGLFNSNGTDFDSLAAWKLAFPIYDSQTIMADPLLKDVSFPDFRLKTTSPCIGGGTPVGLTQDFSGFPLTKNIKPDIGAFQYRNDLTAPKNLHRK